MGWGEMWMRGWVGWVRLGTHPGLEAEPLRACVGPVPGAQRDLHLPQEEVPAQAVVVPHREVQGPALQVPLLQFVLAERGHRQREVIFPLPSIPTLNQVDTLPPKKTTPLKG